jgi:hypothetical protein
MPLLAFAISFGIPWAQLSIGVAACVALVYVAKTVARATTQVVNLVKNISNDNQKFLSNHMSGVTAVLGGLVTQVSLLGEKVDRLHDDNVETQNRLAASAKPAAPRAPRAPRKKTIP